MTEAQSPEIIGNITRVAKYLEENGYCAPGKDTPVSRQKVYGDKKKGLFVFEDPKSITTIEVMAYVARAQLMQASVNRARETEDLNIQKLRHETRKAKEDADRKEFENAKERGLYLKKEEVELMLALKFSSLESILKNGARVDAHDLIAAAVSGNKQAFLDKLYDMIDDKLDQISRMDEIHVVLKRRNG